LQQVDSGLWGVGLEAKEVAKPTTIIQFKMEDVCIFCNVMDILWAK
jgi:hypothetical protein